MLYHLTRCDRLDDILREGLVPGPRLFGDGSDIEETERLTYGGRPVYLSMRPWLSKGDYDLAADYGTPRDFVLLSINEAGLRLLPDIPELIEVLYVHRENAMLVRDAPNPLDRWFIEDQLPLSAFCKEPLAKAAMATTGTCATLSRIESRRIHVVTNRR